MPSTNIVVSDDTKPVHVFEDWSEVPRAYRTRANWELDFRAVKKGEQAKAIFIHRWTKRYETIDLEDPKKQEFKLYHVTQTRTVRKTPLRMARHDFLRYFIKPADRSRLIRWTKGRWERDGDDRWWNPKSDHSGWLKFDERFSLQGVIDHERGKKIYGIFGAENSFHLMIDLDLHNQPLDLFLRRLQVLLDRFHGKQGDCRCHFQVSDRNAGGIHVFFFFGAKSSLASRRRWLTGILHDLHRQHPECQFFKKVRREEKLNIEIYPGNSGHRLPLSRGRTMLLDKPLQLLEHRGKQVQDIVSYIKWLENPNRSYMSKDDVLWFILDRLDLTSAKWWTNTGTSEAKTKRLPATKSQPSSNKSRSLKNRTRSALVGFWMNGESGHFPNLNRAVFITLQALHAEGLSEDDAINKVMQFVDELPNNDLSSRLGAGRSLIEHDTIRDASDVWSKSVNKKWQASIAHWANCGFRVSDKATWEYRADTLDVVVDCEQVHFTTEERQLLIEQMAPLLVGSKQAKKPEKQDEVCNAVAYFLRYVRCCDREVPQSALPKIFAGFAIKIGQHTKQSKFLQLLIDWEWLYVRVPYHHRAKHGGQAKKGRATAYGIGKAMSGKFSLRTQQNNIWSYILSPTFCGEAEFDMDVPCFADQADSILAERSIVSGQSNLQDCTGTTAAIKHLPETPGADLSRGPDEAQPR